MYWSTDDDVDDDDADDVRYRKEHPDKRGEYYEDDDKLVSCLLYFINLADFVFLLFLHPIRWLANVVVLALNL